MPSPPVSRRVGGAIAALCLLGDRAQAQSSEFPSRPVRIIVPSPAGGPTDAIARLVAPRVAEGWTQPAVVDNRVGGTGAVGCQLVARSAPDGHTLLVNASMHAIIPSIMPTLPYNVSTDFTAVALLASGPYVLVAHPSVPARTLADVIALAKARPGTLNYASPGSGTGNHFGTELFKAMAGIDIVHVPYPGAAQATTDTVGGQVQLMLNNMISAVPHIEAGRLRAIAVTSAHRSPALPDVPTFAETLPGFEAITWYGMFGPAGLPDALTSDLNRRANAAMATDAMKSRLAALGVEPGRETAQEFGRFVARETEKWAQVARVSGAKAD